MQAHISHRNRNLVVEEDKNLPSAQSENGALLGLPLLACELDDRV